VPTIIEKSIENPEKCYRKKIEGWARETILSLLLRTAYAKQCNLQFNFALLLVYWLSYRRLNSRL